jgi:hypothetical protein
MEFRPHRLRVPFYDDLIWQGINIHASSAKNVNSMMSVEYSAIRSRFQGVFLAWQQRILQNVSCAAFHFAQFCETERSIRMKRSQRRVRGRIRHLVTSSRPTARPLPTSPRFHLSSIEKGA